MRTALGLVEVLSVEQISEADVSDADAARAGIRSAQAVVGRQPRRRDQPLHRIELRFAGPDPRVALRERATLSASERTELEKRLAQFDRLSPHGPWTRKTLELISQRPETSSMELSAELGRERFSFKRDVRKLKELGLTESLKPGYRLSPRGRAFLEPN